MIAAFAVAVLVKGHALLERPLYVDEEFGHITWGRFWLEPKHVSQQAFFPCERSPNPSIPLPVLAWGPQLLLSWLLNLSDDPRSFRYVGCTLFAGVLLFLAATSQALIGKSSRGWPALLGATLLFYGVAPFAGVLVRPEGFLTIILLAFVLLSMRRNPMSKGHTACVIVGIFVLLALFFPFHLKAAACFPLLAYCTWAGLRTSLSRRALGAVLAAMTVFAAACSYNAISSGGCRDYPDEAHDYARTLQLVPADFLRSPFQFADDFFDNLSRSVDYFRIISFAPRPHPWMFEFTDAAPQEALMAYGWAWLALSVVLLGTALVRVTIMGKRDVRSGLALIAYATFVVLSGFSVVKWFYEPILALPILLVANLAVLGGLQPSRAVRLLVGGAACTTLALGCTSYFLVYPAERLHQTLGLGLRLDESGDARRERLSKQATRLSAKCGVPLDARTRHLMVDYDTYRPAMHTQEPHILTYELTLLHSGVRVEEALAHSDSAGILLHCAEAAPTWMCWSRWVPAWPTFSARWSRCWR